MGPRRISVWPGSRTVFLRQRLLLRVDPCIHVAGRGGAVVPQDQLPRAEAPVTGLVLPPHDRERLENLGGLLPGEIVEVEVERVELACQMHAALLVPGNGGPSWHRTTASSATPRNDAS